jgi:hypothetical protein
VGACRKAKHPATNGVDLPYWLFIYPGEKLGLFYDVNHSGTNFKKRRCSTPHAGDQDQGGITLGKGESEAAGAGAVEHSQGGVIRRREMDSRITRLKSAPYLEGAPHPASQGRAAVVLQS